MFKKNFWKDLFDISNYWKHSKLFDETNKKILGKMKDTFGGVIVHELVELKWKMYSEVKELMVKNIVQQKEWVLQLSLINSKMSNLMKKLLDTK